MKKRIISLILSLILLITLIPAALAEPAKSGVCGDALTWTLSPEGTLEISGTGAMYDYTNREDVPWYAMRKSVKSIVVNEGLTVIGAHAFVNCLNAVSVTLPASMTNIHRNAFLGCLSLKDVYIPDLSAWFHVAFEWPNRYTANPLSTAENLYVNGVLTRDIVVPEDITEINDCPFIGFCGIDSVTIPGTVRSIYEAGAFMDCQNLKRYTVASSNPYYADIDGVLYNKGKTMLCSYPAGRPGDTYEVPASTLIIGASAFANNRRLKHIILNDGLDYIYYYTFSYCTSLEEIVIPDNVKYINHYAFEECPSLKYVVLSSGMSQIPERAFIRDPLRYVVIPSSIKSIGPEAFASFYGDIGDVYYGGNADEWAALLNNTAYGNDSLKNARLHLNTLEPEGHYTVTVTKPTCTAQGYTTYTCPCGNSYKDDYTDALGHDYGKGGVCTRCGEKSGNFKAPSFSSILLDSIRNIFESLFKWLPFC